MRLLILLLLLFASIEAQKLPGSSCSDLPTWTQLRAALQKAKNDKNGGFGNHMWAVLVNRDLQVCAVAFSGATRMDQWPASRVVAAAKGTTASSLSNPNFAMATAHLFFGTQPFEFLWGIENGVPVDTGVAYGGSPAQFGTETDPMVGQVLGGAISFAGGLPLYNSKGELVGGLGLSGDTSCTDHNIAWRTRHELNLDYVPAGSNLKDSERKDNIIFDVTTSTFGTKSSTSGFGHPHCMIGQEKEEEKIAKSLPPIRTPKKEL